MRLTVQLVSLLFVSALLAWPQGQPLDSVERLLKEITEAHGPTGYEGPVRKIMRREFAPISDDIQTDGLGSLIARLDGGSDLRVMMAAHMDEVGMLVRRIRPDGYLTFQTVGGWLGQALINQRYVIMTRKGRSTALPA